ncbi:flotillin family protein [Zavarzinia sp. CC-PAN008]|uniref:flotillin family protein n=1 Tax=Zavarzinia sp. CC-PAN008 TaxID=3243332 RepID=UPI003F74A249
MDLIAILVPTVIILVALVAIGFIIARLYMRASKEIAFVRTGAGGQTVVVDGGALVLPVLHEVIPVNMNTLRLEVRRAAEQALITKDRMRVDVQAEFYVRVQPTKESIANAAQTLGRRTMQPGALKELVEGKFVDALRAVAAEMSMEELHEKRVDFVQRVQRAVSEDILKNGLELESVSLTGLDQTAREFFNPNNAFDAEGLTKLTQAIEERRKRRNDVERETEIQIRTRDLEAAKQKLDLERSEEEARMAQQRQIAVMKAEQDAQIAREQATRKQESETARIQAERETRLAQLQADQQLKEREIDNARLVRQREIEREQAEALAAQGRDIAVAERSKAQSEANAEAERARAASVKAEEDVVTVRETTRAERTKELELIVARQAAEREAIAVRVKAEAEKLAALDAAEAVRTQAQADAERARIAAQGEAEAERARADAAARRYEVEAAGRVALNEADNKLSAEIIAMRTRLALIEQMQAIIAQSVKPMERIESIRIMQVDGMAGGGTGHANGTAAPTSPGDAVVQSALRYRAQAPLIDALLGELGLTQDATGLPSLASLAQPPQTKG